MVTNPKLSLKLNQIDMLLCQTEIREKIYLELGIADADLPYPARYPDKSSYIYGVLSHAIHSPDFRTLWLRDDEDEQIKTYARFLANRYTMKVDSFDREAAAAGCDDICSETTTAPQSLESSGKSSTGNMERVDLLFNAAPVAAAVVTRTGGCGGLASGGGDLEVGSVIWKNDSEGIASAIPLRHGTDSDRPEFAADGEEMLHSQPVLARA